MDLLLLIHFITTWFMVGLIWTIQVVHYPLFALVGSESFPGYEAAHTRRMGSLLVIPASVEVATAAALVWVRPPEVGLALVLASGMVLAGLWVTTALVQVPLHRRLSASADSVTLRRLVTSNWFRTLGWTARGGLVAAMFAETL